MIRISVIDQIEIRVTADQAKAFLLNISNISEYEPKVKSVQATSQTPSTGTYISHGKFLGLSWSGKFTYETNDHGFHSEMVEGTLANKMHGGFIIRSNQDNTCLIKHYESYSLPNWTLFIYPILKRYLRVEMNKELLNISRLLSNRYAK